MKTLLRRFESALPTGVTWRRTALLRQRRPGYTIIEIVVVLILTGIAATLAIPRIDTTRYKADAVVTSVRSVMQQAQRASLVAQYDVIVSFDQNTNRIRVAWDANNDHLITPGERVTWTLLSTGSRFAIPANGVRGTVTTAIVGSSVRTMDNMTTVTFHRDGSLSSELEIYLTSVGHTTLWRAVTVVQATGRTDWYRLSTQTGKWIGGAL